MNENSPGNVKQIDRPDVPEWESSIQQRPLPVSHTLHAELFYGGGVDQNERGVSDAHGACEHAKECCTATCTSTLITVHSGPSKVQHAQDDDGDELVINPVGVCGDAY